MGKPRKKVKRNDDVPEVYRDMLADAGASSYALSDDNGRRVKRRRIGGELSPKETVMHQRIPRSSVCLWRTAMTS